MTYSGTRPKWLPKRGRKRDLQAALSRCRVPTGWPATSTPLDNILLLKTSELLVYAGPAGAWLVAHLDLDIDFTHSATALLHLLKIVQHKISTPGDRQTLRAELPRVVTELELLVPVDMCTMVMHVLVFECLSQLQETGPFCVSQMLDIERFQTVFKRCARGTKNVMRSILNHYLLLEVALSNRLLRDMEWTVKAPRSSAAGSRAKHGSSIRTDRLWAVKGKAVAMELDPDEMTAFEELWAGHDERFAAFLQVCMNHCFAKYFILHYSLNIYLF